MKKYTEFIEDYRNYVKNGDTVTYHMLHLAGVCDTSEVKYSSADGKSVDGEYMEFIRYVGGLVCDTVERFELFTHTNRANTSEGNSLKFDLRGDMGFMNDDTECKFSRVTRNFVGVYFVDIVLNKLMCRLTCIIALWMLQQREVPSTDAVPPSIVTEFLKLIDDIITKGADLSETSLKRLTTPC